jgi:hypothetical protein
MGVDVPYLILVNFASDRRLPVNVFWEFNVSVFPAWSVIVVVVAVLITVVDDSASIPVTTSEVSPFFRH